MKLFLWPTAARNQQKGFFMENKEDFEPVTIFNFIKIFLRDLRAEWRKIRKHEKGRQLSATVQERCKKKGKK
jgi:hypothetical protein